MIGPRHHVERGLGPWSPRRREDRDHRRHERSYHADLTPPDERIVRPITSAEVRLIASKGYPLWESLDAMQLRNRRITVAYSDLSENLADLIAGAEGRREANWCTFATWSSKTIGAWIEHDDVPEPLSSLGRLPWAARHAARRFGHYILRREDGASYRSLAAGNRFVFLEIGLTVARFVETFHHVDRARGDRPDEGAWDAYWRKMRAVLRELSQLDPSWMLTEAPEPIDLQLGMRQYYEALFAADPKQRAELVLAGNLLIGAYEQRRVDGYICAALALFTKRATRALVQRRTGKVKGRLRWGLSNLYARVMTRGLVLNTHDEQLQLARPLSVPETYGWLFPPDLDAVTTPLLQALLTRYDLCDGKHRRRRGRNWTCFDDRMNYITNLFRSRQQHPTMFVRPFQPEVERALLDGRLDTDATQPLPDGPDLDGDGMPDALRRDPEPAQLN